jgi:YD repeat-containing protein
LKTHILSSYDAQGRIQTMTTWTNFAARSGGATTTWRYSPYRGWLTNKVYADGKGTLYDYSLAGRIASRTWARGTNTTYSYNNAGDLAAITFNDGGTAGVSFGYDRRGQQTSVVQGGTATLSRAYNDAGYPLSEVWTGGFLDATSVTNGYDHLLRRTNVIALTGGTTVLAGFTNIYDLASRLLRVSDLNNNSATYSYLANSPLVEQVVFQQNGTARMTTTRQFDLLNRLTSISSAPFASFAYAYNSANQRTAVTNIDASRWVFGYDPLGQVTSGKKYWNDGSPVAGQQFEYGFDDIGNRTTAATGGDPWGRFLRRASYAANNLNQYTSRTIPAGVDVLGAATNAATVTVNDQPTSRKSDYFRVELSLMNTSAPVWLSITNLAVLANGSNPDIVSNKVGGLFIPQSPEAFSYDADGNLTQDGRWDYTWDGENRLIRMVTRTAVGPQQRVEFGYDFQGRRVSKKVWANSQGTGTPVQDVRFLYDGWNVVAELNATNRNVVRSFTWGLDLSGSPHGAGGVGGLLAVRSVDLATTGFAAYDGNGNVAGLVSAADGTVLAQY